MYGPRSSALALDAGDGVIDGKYYGSPIVSTDYQPTVAASSQRASLAQDAADGVIDGNYFGARVGVAAGPSARRVALRIGTREPNRGVFDGAVVKAAAENKFTTRVRYSLLLNGVAVVCYHFNPFCASSVSVPGRFVLTLFKPIFTCPVGHFLIQAWGG